MPNQPSFDMFAEPEPSPPTLSRATARPAAGGAGVALSFDRLIPDGQLRVTKEIIAKAPLRGATDAPAPRSAFFTQ